MKSLLKKKWAQRAIYALGLLALIILSFKDGIDILNHQSSLGIKYWYFFVVPSIILVYQIIFNNRIGWVGILALYGLYVLWFLHSAITGVPEKMGYIDASDYFLLGIVFLALILLGVLLYQLNPIKSE